MAVFSDEQKIAIETTDKSVLVSAAAGSGKTTVLVERIIRIILSGKANVDEMLVVTFTNAAAAEMRLRLTRAIRNRMANHPEDAPRMKEQLARMYRSYISTIDSFALRVIREFFHETDLEPSFGICDEVQGELMRRDAIEGLFEDAFADDALIEGGSFRAFLRLYSEERTEDRFAEQMLDAYSKLRTMPDYFDWAFEKAEQLHVTPETFEGSYIHGLMLADAAETFGQICEAFRRVEGMFSDAGIYEMYEEKLKPQADALYDIYEAVRDGRLDRDVINAISSVPKVTLNAKKVWKESYEPIKADVKAVRESIKKEIEGFQHRYIDPDIDTRLAETDASCGYTLYFLRLLQEFERRYDAVKREQRLIDFADMEHIAAGILKNEEAADILRKRFKYIFVDEYQDTNNIQEHLISRIARPDNVFRVGDVKQSIYRFRQAEPRIFEKLYRQYNEEGGGVAIDLGRNFRTNDRTIRYINHVFAGIMESYDERAMLYTGLSVPDEYDFTPEVHLLLEEGSEEGGAASDSAAAEDNGFIDGEIEELTKEEAEAEYIAGLVKSMIGTEFYDSKKGVVRRARAGDIAILFRAVRYRGEIMSRALRDCGIEPHIEEAGEYFDTVEISIALALLSCIDNMKRDVPLIAVLHSEVFGFDPSELADIRIAHNEYADRLRSAEGGEKPYRRAAYQEAFSWYAKEGPESALRDKAAAAEASLLGWRAMSRMMPLEDFVWKVLVDSGYYRMAGAMSGGARRQANLRSLADRAARFSKDRAATLSAFITFLDAMRSKKLSSGQTPAAGNDDDAVRIMTIHKSKGLEYPFVIVGGLGHKFREDNNEKAFSFDSDTGVGLPYIDPSRKFWRSTMMQRAINIRSRRDGYREELRLLYVAMTRARSRLCLVGTCKSEEDLAKYEARPKNFIKAMREVLKTGFDHYHISPLTLTRKAGANMRAASAADFLKTPLSSEEQALYDEIDRRFAYRYPDEELLSSKAKYSVSAVRRAELEARQQAAEDAETGDTDEAVSQADEEMVRLWRGSERKKKASAADIGVAYHRVMEFVDFARCVTADGRADEQYIRERVDFLHANDAIEDEVYSSLDLSKISAFFESSLGQRTVAAAKRGTLQREKPFTLKTVRDGREMLVQGVIDCCFEDGDGMVLIDYKSSFIKPGRQHEAELARIRDEYAVQIELYSEAMKKGTGKEVSEAYLWLFATSEALQMSS